MHLEIGDYERGPGKRMKDLGKNDWSIVNESSTSREGPSDSSHTLPYTWNFDVREALPLWAYVCVLGVGKWEHVITARRWGPQERAV